jgi:predicted HTH domain antitoxin
MRQATLNIEMPASILTTLPVSRKQLPDYILKTLAVELFREGKLSLGKARELANLPDKWEMIRLLGDRGVSVNYTEDDAEVDVASLDRLLA